MRNFRFGSVLIFWSKASEANLLTTRVLKVQEKQGPFSFVLCCGFDPRQVDSFTAAKTKEEQTSMEIYLSSQTTDKAPLKEPLQKNIYSMRPFEVFEVCGFRISFMPVGQLEDWSAFNKLAESCACSRIQLDIAVIDISLDSRTLRFPKPHTHLSKGLAQLKPRYIFCSVQVSCYCSGYAMVLLTSYQSYQHFEYGPFAFDGSLVPSRFIHLSNVGSKQKWLYALSLKPIAYMNDSELTKELSSDSMLANPFKSDSVVQTNSSSTLLQNNSLDSEPTKAEQISCWFCLANEKDLHLIIDVGHYCFLAVAKGYLSKYHVLIVPIEHVGSRFELSKEAWQEVVSYLSSLESWWRSMNLQIFWFERCIKPPTGNKVNHMQIQVIGMPIKESPSYVSSLLDRESKKLRITVRELESETELEDEYRLGKISEYILFKLPDGCYALHVVENPKKRKSLDAQSPYFALFSFGRKIAALAMRIPQKIDWKKSVNDFKEEQRVTNELREEFFSWKRKMSS